MVPLSLKRDTLYFLISLCAAVALRSSRKRLAESANVVNVSSILLSAGKLTALPLSDYEIDEENPIGEGSYGKVFPARKREKNGSVGAYLYATKKVRKSDYEISDEGDVMQLELPFVAGSEAIYRHGQYVWLVMRLYEGGDVKKFIHEKPEPDYELVKSWSAQMAYGLWTLHRKAVLYGDLKPANTLIVNKELKQVVLSDFGASRTYCYAEACTHDEDRGTPGYVSPSIVHGNWYGFEVDWWAHAVSLYEMTQGVKLPVSKKEWADVFARLESTQDGSRLSQYLNNILDKGRFSKFETNKARLQMVGRASAHPFLRDSFWHNYDSATEAEKIDQYWYDLCMKLAVHNKSCVQPDESDAPEGFREIPEYACNIM
eukprot:TRINITY_DN23652_c1_g1_i1.p1 TRINITY_DN23652_c1_g1~~TRINITY_DN23652_c1_g1_i1.p1  ORF type:complete len:373 (-),score=32.22 TRINITY_DN23652_c1_g1_i1:88-1206(-)